VKQISYGKQSETQNTTPEIHVMVNAMLEPQVHLGKQVKCLGKMTNYDYNQTPCADEL
jgi:hypothetical protein